MIDDGGKDQVQVRCLHSNVINKQTPKEYCLHSPHKNDSDVFWNIDVNSKSKKDQEEKSPKSDDINSE